ncbi:hypothetical protein [Brevundimonas diminuta]|uniref:hypothetical protein n=1 Tax=Brevundimonas diminuta TaxID=293 RepID=UPI001F589048|nr:hypothetical protein [Brevundimonas diminuta]
MTIPTGGPFTSEQVRTEWRFTAPFTSSQVSSAAGLNTPWSSDQLRGKSARTVSLVIQSFEQVRTNWGQWNEQQYDRITFGISVTPYLAPSSYTWGNDVSGTASTAVFTGSTYQTQGFTYQNTGQAYCSVVVGGRVYELTLDFQYTAGDVS